MSLAIDLLTQQKPLSFDEFLARYGSDNRYELIDREVFDSDKLNQYNSQSQIQSIAPPNPFQTPNNRSYSTIPIAIQNSIALSLKSYPHPNNQQPPFTSLLLTPHSYGLRPRSANTPHQKSIAQNIFHAIEYLR